MASDNEAGPSKKHPKLDTTPSNDVRTLNSLFPKIDNLEHFPLKVLLQIFDAIGDVDLLSLAENSTRFESIAKMVVNQRYADKYFTIDNSMYGSQAYQDFIRLFGSEIKSIEAKYTENRGNNQWIESLLNRTNRLEKLSLGIISTDSNERLLDEHVSSSITHLTLRSEGLLTGNGFTLSKFRSLKKFALEGYPSISELSLDQVIINNPSLESLCMNEKTRHSGDAKMVELFPFDKLMATIGTNLKKLKEFAYTPTYWDHNKWQRRILDELLIESFVTSMEHLESLALSTIVCSFTNHYELYRRLGSECKNLKHLELLNLNLLWDLGQYKDGIHAFERIESLVLKLHFFDNNDIVSLVEHLPFLRRLEIDEAALTDDSYQREWSFISTLLQRCPSLEKLIIRACRGVNVELFGTASFFTRFIRCIQMPNVKLEVKLLGWGHVGTITKEEVIWRKKRVYWVGYDPSLNSSTIHLMDLANRPTAATAEELNNPFNVILGYLDLCSLQSLSRANRKCSQLVGSYVKQHSQRNGTFIITDEFFTNLNEEYKQLNMFSEYVTNLQMNIYHSQYRSKELQNMLKRFHNLNKVYVHPECNNRLDVIMVPQVRHLICDISRGRAYFNFCYLSDVCPDIETIELIAHSSSDLKYLLLDRTNLRQVKKFTLISDNPEHLHQLQAVVEDPNTKIVFKTIPKIKR